jgi:hypothetical protein
MTKIKHATREQWLEAFVEAVRPWFKEVGATLPKKVRVSVGFPFNAKKAIGQCWYAESSADKAPQIFVSPVLGTVTEVDHVVIHELVHASGLTGHGKDFRKVAVALGLEGKMTATTAGPELRKRLTALTKTLGTFPHAALDPSGGAKKKQTTRMIKTECGECGYVARLSQKWIDEVGAPHCPNHGEMEVA